jgi:hypothetical protein
LRKIAVGYSVTMSELLEQAGYGDGSVDTEALEIAVNLFEEEL